MRWDAGAGHDALPARSRPPGGLPFDACLPAPRRRAGREDGGEAGLWLDTERVALQELFNMIRRFKLGRDVELHKRTVQRGLLSGAGRGRT